ncbi:MAG: protein-L-isoaspartate(D-aspartate) O-methyltransferase [Nitrospirae bacterium]|nr:protein-L-isoaspartate(D-aspartate) O-methyltransferase [Candidatus Manganitrophaceae bacterium]
MNHYETARRRMVEDQLVARGIKDERVLAAMRKVPRHLFVEEAFRDRAYGDHALPIGDKQTISQPYMVGLMSEALGLKGTEKVLEIGTGSGYQTAVLAELSARVCSIERIQFFVSRAWKILGELGYRNTVIHLADGSYGWKDEAPFDAILVAAGAPQIPPILLDQLKVGGRMIVPVGERASQILKKIIKEEKGVTSASVTSCLFVPLLGASGWEKEEEGRGDGF